MKVMGNGDSFGEALLRKLFPQTSKNGEQVDPPDRGSRSEYSSYRIGDHMSLREGEYMPAPPPGMKWVLISELLSLPPVQNFELRPIGEKHWPTRDPGFCIGSPLPNIDPGFSRPGIYNPRRIPSPWSKPWLRQPPLSPEIGARINIGEFDTLPPTPEGMEWVFIYEKGYGTKVYEVRLVKTERQTNVPGIAPVKTERQPNVPEIAPELDLRSQALRNLFRGAMETNLINDIHNQHPTGGLSPMGGVGMYQSALMTTVMRTIMRGRLGA